MVFGYPGRVGILPEITIFTLKAAADPLLKAYIIKAGCMFHPALK
jgi:hypothetical protein